MQGADAWVQAIYRGPASGSTSPEPGLLSYEGVLLTEWNDTREGLTTAWHRGH